MPQQRKYTSILNDKNFTSFQKRVYKAVLAVPKGEARSYKWVAEKIGNSKALRAVGQALKKNPYLGIVPCHRVIKEDGSIGGFSKGTARKRRMLKAEGLDLR